jgi:serine/threonine-protein kinase
MGTPGYMSPEQAGGQWELVGPASDLFRLGAILYDLLTGRAPFQGSHVKEVLANARQGGFANPRRVNRTVPSSLEAVCLKAMATKPEARYASAEELAADVDRWLADEPVSACREPWPVRLGRWLKRHRTQVTGVAAALLVALLAVGVGWLWRERDRQDRRTVTVQGVNAALAKAEQLASQARRIAPRDPARAEAALQLWKQTRSAVEQAESALATGLADDALQRAVAKARAGVEAEQGKAERRLAQARKEAAFLAALRKARERRVTIVENQFNIAGSMTAYAEAFEAYGQDLTTEPMAAAVAWLKALPEEVREAALAGLHDWAAHDPSEEMQDRLLGMLDGADGDGWRRRYRQALRAGDAGLLHELVREARTRPLPAVHYPVLAQLLVKVGRNEEAADLLRRARLLHPQDFWIPVGLGSVLSGPGGLPHSTADLEEVTGCYRTALAIRPDSSAALCNLGNTLHAQNKLDEAVDAYRKAIAIDPNYASAYTNLGSALHAQNKLDEAVDTYRKALAVDPRFAPAYTNLGVALHAQNKLDEAVDAHGKALAIDPTLAKAYSNLGRALHAQNKLDEAVVA